MRIFNPSTLLNNEHKFLLALMVTLSISMWVGHIYPHHLHSEQLSSGQPCGVGADHSPQEFQRPQTTGHLMPAVNIYMEPVFFEPEEYHHLFHALTRARKSSSLVLFQYELHGIRLPERSYQAPKLYLSQQSFLC